jgi:hypothetical protein
MNHELDLSLSDREQTQIYHYFCFLVVTQPDPESNNSYQSSDKV